MTAPYGGYNSEPTMPGPWSVLQTLGSQAGNVIAAHHQFVQEQRQRATATAQQILKMRELGYVKPEDFNRPDVQAVFTQAGIPLPSPTPTPNEAIGKARAAILAEPNEGAAPVTFTPPALLGGFSAPVITPPIGGRPSIDKSRLLGIASPGEAAQDKLRAAQAAADLPNVPGVATAGAQGSQDPVMNSVADRVVNDLFVKLGRVPTVAEAMAQGAQDIRAKQYGDQLNEPFYGAAIQRLKDNQARLAIQKEAAGNKGAAVAADDTKKQQDALNAQINDLRGQRAQIDKSISTVGKAFIGLNKLDKLSPSDRTALQQEQDIDDQIREKQHDLATLNSVGSGRVSARNPGDAANILNARNAWDAQRNAVMSNLDKASPQYAQQISSLRAQGKTDRQIATIILTEKIGGRP